MHIQRFEVGPFAQNTYLIWEDPKHALLIDAGFSNENEFNTFFEFLATHHIEVDGILLTHAHVDHILGLQRLLQTIDSPVYHFKEESFLWENFEHQARMFGFNAILPSITPLPLTHNQIVKLQNIEIKVLYTPGHAPDHCSFFVEHDRLLLSGDALFKESIGRTDLYKGDLSLLLTSIRQELLLLGDQVKVYPGHGPATTIGHEKLHNPYLG
jgi:glyoxylase-like metal-dependent hydrolase (beta-lactamase superfamily II)